MCVFNLPPTVTMDRILLSLAFASGAYKLAWQRAKVPLKGEKVNCWFIKTEDPEPIQLPQFFTTPLEISMAQWMETRKRWDAAIAKRARMGRTLTPKDMNSYQSFLKNSTRKLVFDTALKIHVARPSKMPSSSLQSSVVVEVRMDLDPAHLALRFNDGPFFHLFVREFEITTAPSFVDELHEKVVPIGGPADIPQEDDEQEDGGMSDHDSEFEDIHPDILEFAAPKASWATGPCHEGME